MWTHPDCDAFARSWIRLQETREATRIVDQLLDSIPTGPIMAKVPRIIKVPEGEAWVATENPLGEMGYYIVSKGDLVPFPGQDPVGLGSATSRSCRGSAAASTSPTSSPSWPACTSSSVTSTDDPRARLALGPRTGSRRSSSWSSAAVLVPTTTLILGIVFLFKVMSWIQSPQGSAGGRPRGSAAAPRRRGQVRAEGGSGPRQGRPVRVQGRAARRAHVGRCCSTRCCRPASTSSSPISTWGSSRARRLVALGDRRAHGRVGFGQQVLADGRPAGRGPADRLRAAAGAGRRRRGDPGGHSQPPTASSRLRPTARSSASSGLGNPFILTQFVGFFIFLAAVQAELTQPPFDMPVAESELVGGYQVEYSGFRFLTFFLAEFATAFAFAGIAATLFLGGWWFPGVDPSSNAYWTSSDRSCCSRRS